MSNPSDNDDEGFNTVAMDVPSFIRDEPLNEATQPFSVAEARALFDSKLKDSLGEPASDATQPFSAAEARALIQSLDAEAGQPPSASPRKTVAEHSGGALGQAVAHAQAPHRPGGVAPTVAERAVGAPPPRMSPNPANQIQPKHQQVLDALTAASAPPPGQPGAGPQLPQGGGFGDPSFISPNAPYANLQVDPRLQVTGPIQAPNLEDYGYAPQQKGSRAPLYIVIALVVLVVAIAGVLAVLLLL